MKKIISIILCLCFLLCTTACKSEEETENPASTPAAATSSDTSSTTSNPVSDDASSSETESEPAPELSDEAKELLEMLYGFSSISGVKTFCVRNTSDSDALYAVSSVITNAGEMKDLDIEITSSNSAITAENGIITISREYAKNNSSAPLTVKHTETGLSYSFTLNLEKEWDSIFADEFNGTELNTDVWNVWESDDWQYFYSADSVFLDGKGNLVNRIQINETPNPSNGYTKQSGAITTDDKFESTYGYYEIRMTSHKSAGLMGAFWMMCGDMGDKNAADDGTAKNGCEIDIMETFYHALNPAHTIHWDGYTHTKTQTFPNTGREDIWDGNYHTYGFRWSPEEYVFLIDGVVTARCNTVDICTEPGYLLISTHFNNRAGEPSFGVGEHSDMLVDYVRVYQSPTDPV